MTGPSGDMRSAARTRLAERRGHRLVAVWATIGVLTFLGATAVAGGVAMLSGTTPPDDWLDRIPVIDSWVVPGVVLGVGFGFGSLLTVYGIARRPGWRWPRFTERLARRHWSWLATILIGLGHLVWITLELVYLPQQSVLQAVYGAVGVALVLLPLHPVMRRYLAMSPGQLDKLRQRERPDREPGTGDVGEHQQLTTQLIPNTHGRSIAPIERPHGPLWTTKL